MVCLLSFDNIMVVFAASTTKLRTTEACCKHVGVPAGVAEVIASVWCEQQRLMTYAGYVHPEIQGVSTSLPHTDSWSMLGLVLVLSTPTRSVTTNFFKVSRSKLFSVMGFFCDRHGTAGLTGQSCVGDMVQFSGVAGQLRRKLYVFSVGENFECSC